MSTREAMQRALDALISQKPVAASITRTEHWVRECVPAIEALRAELAKPEPEPVGWLGRQGQFMSDRHYVVWARKDINNDFIPLYRKGDL